jgi:hypothetical protein
MGMSDDLKRIAHELNNGLAAARLWLIELEHAAVCADCADRQAEPLASLARVLAELELATDRIRGLL